MSDIKTTKFTTNLDIGCRWRHQHTSFKNQIIGFVIQLEIFFNDNKSPLIFTDYADALNFAQFDIKTNWEKYRENFYREVKKHD